jgi:hypothetical protein
MMEWTGFEMCSLSKHTKSKTVSDIFLKLSYIFRCFLINDKTLGYELTRCDSKHQIGVFGAANLLSFHQSGVLENHIWWAHNH